VSIGGVVAIFGLLLSVFAAGGGRQQGPTTGSATSAPPSAADSAARVSCADFDQATGRLAAKDTKGFIDAMTAGATAAQEAAAKDQAWQSLVVGFAAFATDLGANDATKVSNDLAVINQVCAQVRGTRPLNLNGGP
jgi:hypothetical protein